ncbi:LysR family transcriptional regulator [Mesorhizobium sp. M1A.F.Ca.ET.072.01.1.1]|uniref:LysR family transcriptional regulator n=1 Tax=Mesorhizobium sp. M1A.F.Ca.ET.072.01.1.1 TaxID=2496753 RepID=UPI000FD32518|nr:LysR family transcriptional regulator [Mesorhizobium sp. M1A.F.Ca.ET.072.01.1.1]RUW54081.1 LysR family transcriptional regulator [Mesorhizobium sp. M1A.F.Ca.ET.072.01.1.1]TIV03407.1 MAG: LysR family transcriptional regulator [Mesorhizobium sp.]
MKHPYYDLPCLGDLETFEALGRHLSLKLAASELNITPATVSRRIKAIEKELGVSLVAKLGTTVALTGPGEDLHGVLENISSSASDIVRRVKASGDKQGETRIASSKMFLNVQPLPHISCSIPKGMSRGNYGTAEHGDTERTDGCGFRALSCFDASGEGQNFG